MKNQPWIQKHAIAELSISGVIFLSACVLYYVAASFPNYQGSDQVGPALWPKMLLIAILILSGYLLFRSIRGLMKSVPRAGAETDPAKKAGGRMLILSILLSLLYGFGVAYVGFLLAVFLFQLLFLLILRVRSIWMLTLYPLCMTAVVYGIFIKVLYIPLPRGAGIFLTFSRFFY